MRAKAWLLVVSMAAVALGGCLSGEVSDTSGTGDRGQSDGEGGNATRVTSAIRPVAPEPAVDRRFGEDRELTRQDLESLLPVDALTDYNTTKDYLLSMVPKPEFRLYESGITIEGRFIFGVLISDDGAFHADRPTVFFTCSQHGNEPSGSEACLIMIEYFVHGVDQFAKDVRSQLNIIMLPLANPDGKEANKRANHDEVDINRDHMDMVTIEGQAIHNFFNAFDPEIIMDLHEFGGRGEQHPLYPTVPVSTYDYFEVAAPQTFYNNDEEMIAVNYELESVVVRHMWDTYGAGSAGHYPSQNFVSSIQRNHYGMHNSLSLLFETGGGLGTINIDLRTNLHLEASFVVLENVLADPARILDLERSADSQASSPTPGVQGWVVPNQTDLPKFLGFLDIHNVSYEIMESDASYMVSHYEVGAEAPPSERSFSAGDAYVTRWQADGRVAYEIFEATHDEYYDHGPRDAAMDVWRVVEA